MSTSNATPNYQVTAESAAGLLFKNKRDRKILNVDPKVLTVDLHSFLHLFVPSATEFDNLTSKHSVPEMMSVLKYEYRRCMHFHIVLNYA